MTTTRSTLAPARLPLTLAVLGALALSASMAPAFAQQAQPAPQPRVAQPGQAAVLAAQENQTADTDKLAATNLDTVVVTANKRLENVREVAASISVVSAEQIENFHATQLTDFAAYVPGFQVDSGGSPGQASISLRGIAPVGPGATVATYIDEVPVGSSGNLTASTMFALDLLPYDLERVEILRGPQGTLYGAGAMGGLLKYVTRAPDLDNTEFRVGGGISTVEGGGNGWDVRFGANLPLANHNAALRIGYARNELPGFIDNVVSGKEDVNETTQESLRIAYKWQLADAVDLNFSLMQQTIDNDDTGAVELDAVDYRPRFGDLTNDSYIPEAFEKKIDFYSATVNWDLGWGTFTSATGYSQVETDKVTDATLAYGTLLPLFGLPNGKSGFYFGLDFEKLTQEFRLTSSGDGKFQWQAGLFYTDEHAENSQVVTITDFNDVPIPGLDPLATISLPSWYKETAVFGDVSYRFNDVFKLSGGLRFSKNEQEFMQVGAGAIVANETTVGKSSEDVTTWMISPQLQLNPTNMLYARVATGYRPGGPNVAVAGVPSSVDADTLTSYEIGLKSEFAERRVQVDLAVYRIDWNDIQVTGTNGIVSYLVNGGTALSQGAELATAFRVTDRWQFGINAAYTDAKLTEDVPGINGLDGDRLPYIPRFSWSLTSDYVFPIGASWNGRVGGGYRWVGDRYTDVPSNPNAIPVDSYGAFDINADVANANWTLRAYVRNLTDERAYLTYGVLNNAFDGSVSRVQAVPITPRTIGLEVDYRF